MPFTFSHPAIAIPLLKLKYKFSITALVIGSLVPDFEYIFQMQFVDNLGHHLKGIFLFDLPAGILLCYFFHYIIRNAFITHLPSSIYKYFSGYISFSWNDHVLKNKMNILISLLIGIVSHLLWDSFTHYDGGIVLMFEPLKENVNLFLFQIPVYILLQLISSFIGLAFIAQFIYSKKDKSEVKINTGYNINYWILFLLFFLIILVFRIVISKYQVSLWDVLLFIIGSLSYALIITSLLFFKANKNIIQE